MLPKTLNHAFNETSSELLVLIDVDMVLECDKCAVPAFQAHSPGAPGVRVQGFHLGSPF